MKCACKRFSFQLGFPTKGTIHAWAFVDYPRGAIALRRYHLQIPSATSRPITPLIAGNNHCTGGPLTFFVPFTFG